MNVQMNAWYRNSPEQPQGVSVTAQFDTVEEGQEFAAQFPKSAKVKAATLRTTRGGSAYFTAGYVVWEANLLPSGVKGDINETGLRRLRSVLKTLAGLGIEPEWSPSYGNSYKTRAEFEEVIAR